VGSRRGTVTHQSNGDAGLTTVRQLPADVEAPADHGGRDESGGESRADALAGSRPEPVDRVHCTRTRAAEVSEDYRYNVFSFPQLTFCAGVTPSTVIVSTWVTES
jgi:hypothetical protein